MNKAQEKVSRKPFCQWVESTYHKPVKAVLKSFEKRGLVYEDVVLISSYSVNTIRKWCRKYDVYLSHNKNNQSAEIREIMIARMAKAKLNTCNILSKAWQ
ncbi:hypothetical protein [Cysteiniphilum litorale]|uniref:hypothetical protein n=1 Tax=Cysteiniphilum litorale TaxID=2056700 RepID=UPI003F881690